LKSIATLARSWAACVASRFRISTMLLAAQSAACEVRLINSPLVAFVDECDFARVSAHQWRARQYPRNHNWYAVSASAHMHRLIAAAMGISGIGRTLHVDHIDGNGLNNCRSNLRVATPSQNRANAAKRSSASSSFKGVSLHRPSGRWQAKIKINGKQYWLGGFRDQVSAAKRYDEAALKAFGPFARLNFPPQET